MYINLLINPNQIELARSAKLILVSRVGVKPEWTAEPQKNYKLEIADYREDKTDFEYY